jgi:hypothetical protein
MVEILREHYNKEDSLTHTTNHIAHGTNVPIASSLAVTCNDNILIGVQVLVYLLN